MEVVCLHGLGRSSADWDRVRPALEAFGRVSVPDLPRRPDDAFEVARRAVPDRAIVIGHSMGGVMALRLAHHDPKPSALVLTNSFFPPARNGRGTLETARDYLSHRIAYVRSMRGAGRDAGSRASTASALRVLAGLAVRRNAFERAVGSVNVPVLVVHGRDDQVVPVDFAIAAAESRPGWSIEIPDSGGHSVHLNQPEAWVALVTPFLRSLAGYQEGG